MHKKEKVMRKFKSFILVVTLLFMAGIVYAQQPRSGGQHGESEGKTSVTAIAVTGLDISGVPGYVEFINGAGNVYYLYVDLTGDLKLASAAQVMTGASPQTTDWTNQGTVVGSQS